MPDHRRIVRDTPAYHEADSASAVIFNLRPGQIVEVVSEDDITFTRVTHLAQPVFVRRDDTVHAAAEEIAAVAPQTPPAQAATTEAGFCPHCGAPSDPGARFCKRCGGSLLPPEASTPHGELAGSWTRFAALLIDSVIVSIIAIAIAAGPAAVIGVQSYNDDAPYFSQAVKDEAIEDATAKAIIVVYVTLIPAMIIYFTIGYATGGTLAARMLGLRIIREDGSNPGLIRGFVRWIVSIISYNVLYLGYLWAIWDDDSQTWHDKAAGTYVVKKSHA